MTSVNESTSDPGHAPVMHDQVLAALAPTDGETALDCTAGRGGHAEAMARAVGTSGTIVICDLDPENLDFAAERVRRRTACTVYPLLGSFARAPRDLIHDDRRADVVLADLGVASTQIDTPARGFSFLTEGPLDMRMDPTGPVTASDLVMSSSAEELSRIIREFGEEPLARRIAGKIVARRRESPIETTAELANLVREAYGARAAASRNHPATRTFQALRIAVNDELGALDGLLRQLMDAGDLIARGRPTWLNPGSRVAFLTFHSLEDRRVKRAFAAMKRAGLAELPSRTPAGPTETEITANPRSRSAKLRVATVGGPQGPS